MSFLASILRDQHKSTCPFILVQSSAAQSALPVLRALIDAQSKHNVFLLCMLYPPETLLSKQQISQTDTHIFDWTSEVPGFTHDDEPGAIWNKRIAQVLGAIEESSSKAATVIADSLDTIVDDLQSASIAYRLISRIERALSVRKDASRLICHMSAFSPLLPMLQAPSFSPSLTRIAAYPPALLLYIFSAYFALPPLCASSCSQDSEPSQDDLKFWRVFVPLADRPRAIERLVFSPDAEVSDVNLSVSNTHGVNEGNARTKQPSSSSSLDEFVVEVLVRSRRTDALHATSAHAVLSGSGSGESTRRRRRGAERVLLGWKRKSGGGSSSSTGEAVELESLDTLRSMWQKRQPASTSAATAASSEVARHDSMKDLPFKLNLTEQQRVSRSQVPLPYERTGTVRRPDPNQAGQIIYDPDSADDLDEEDPDEDLNI